MGFDINMSRQPKTKPGDPERTIKARQVFEFMRQGVSALSACKKLGLKHSTLADWFNEDKDLAAEYVRARGEFFDFMAEEIIVIADEPVGTNDRGGMDSAAVNKQRLQIDARKWILAKALPKKYGDRVTLAGEEDSPLQVKQTIDTSKLSTATLAEIMAAKDAEQA